MPPGATLLEASHPTAQPQHSKETTPAPDSQAQTKAPVAGANVSSTTFQDTRSLMEAFTLLSRYGDEFMDENPLVGEPGSFILSKS
jgi:hypothetical protein